MSNLDTPNKEDESKQTGDFVSIDEEDVNKPTIEWLIDELIPLEGLSPLQKFNRDRLLKLIKPLENLLEEDLKVVCEEDEDLRKKLAMYVAGLAESGDNFMKPEMVSQEVRTAYVDSLFCLVKSRDQRIALEARIYGMEQAKSRVLRRTEIPKDAKNPTRDYVVILGEQIAQFIDDDIATLKQSQKEE